VAADHYHRWESDLDHLAALGVDAYRFSIAWPRVQPTGQGAVNPAGVAFYDRLVDGLLARGIKPVATLYHWDLPQPLEDAGGWVSRDTAYRFADYARLAVGALGDRVHTWTTLNEPWCSAYLGYATGEHAPGRTNRAAALTAAHHLNLAHGLGVAVMRELAPASQSSVTLNLHEVQPASQDPADQDAARRVDAVGNRIFLSPMLDGEYPADLIEDTRAITDWSFVRPGDTALINAPLDVLGVNYYTASIARQGGGPAVDPAGRGGPFVGCDDVEFVPYPGPVTEMGWTIVPAGLTRLLLDLGRRYPDLPLMITENGAAYADTREADGRVHDHDRVAYLRQHLDAVGAAIDAGAQVRGYFVWSLIDNFEWARGYAKRFGIIHVDYETQRRVWKDSAYWYRDVIASNALVATDCQNNA
jgi:beta-glucosidase